MTDILSADRRSELMRRVRRKGTTPERDVRRVLWRMGYRYRLNGKGLPGSPDIVFRSRKKAIFVHGCFWHAHQNCNKWKIPGSNEKFWKTKFFQNVVRDKRKIEELQHLGYDVMVVWECKVSHDKALEAELQNFLNNPQDIAQHRGPVTFAFDVSLEGRCVTRNTFLGGKKIKARSLNLSTGELDSKDGSCRDDFDLASLRSTERPNFLLGCGEIRVADLFSGCGGLSLGAAEACQALGLSFRSVLALDIDRTSLAVYEANLHPDKVENLDVIKVIDGKIGKTATDAERDLARIIHGRCPI